MSDELKDRVLEFAAIAKACPDNLQEKCFDLLLADYLASRSQGARKDPDRKSELTDDPARDVAPDTAEASSADGAAQPGQQDVRIADIHMKARKFLQKYSLTVDDVNALFYSEGGEFKPLYEDLKTTRMAEGQIRIALLHALMSGMKTGEFQADGEQVRAECNTRKCYDLNNFAANFKKNANLFDGFDKYEKGTPIRLSEDGRKELASIIKELAK